MAGVRVTGAAAAQLRACWDAVAAADAAAGRDALYPHAASFLELVEQVGLRLLGDKSCAVFTGLADDFCSSVTLALAAGGCVSCMQPWYWWLACLNFFSAEYVAGCS